MRRSPVVIGATIAGTAGILVFHTNTPAVVATASTTTRSTTMAVSTPVTSSSVSARSTSTSSSTSSRLVAASASATGDPIATRYGDVQVRVTVSGGKITNVQAVQLTNADPRSVAISSSAAPRLRQEALSRQSANIDAISGASYTSAGYAQSLQSALDKLGFKATSGARATLQVPS